MIMTGREWQTMAFLTPGTMQLSVAIALRGRSGTRANPSLLVALAAAWLLQLAAVYLTSRPSFSPAKSDAC
jgi:Ca2+-transporting ATPase